MNQGISHWKLMNILHKRLKVDANEVKLSIYYLRVTDSVKPSMMEVIDDEAMDFVVTMAENKNIDGIKLFIN